MLKGPFETLDYKWNIIATILDITLVIRYKS